MKADELEKKLEKEYAKRTSPNFDISVLIRSPEMVLIYEEPLNYKNPEEVDTYFRSNSDEQAYKASDGFVYFNDKSAIRMRDIGEVIRRIFDSTAIQQYIDRTIDGSALKLKPEGWELHQTELGRSPRKDAPYFNACYNIPDEDHYKLCISASISEGGPSINVSVFITNPEFPHLDGLDSASYPIYLELVKGIVTNPKLFKLEPLQIEGNQ